MHRQPIFAAAALGLVAATLSPPLPLAGQGEVVRSEEHAFRVVTVAEGLQNPWSMAFLPNGDLLVTERPGRLRIVRSGVLSPDPIPGTPEVRAMGQGGLLEVALHPNFAQNGMLYLTYSKPSADGSQATTALARGHFDGSSIHELSDIFVAEAWANGGNHFGSRIVFNDDGTLFMTIGDRGANPLGGPTTEHPAQDPSNHQGVILRLNDDGSVPADNPFVGREGYRPEIWAYGIRSPQGLAKDAAGNLWEAEHGPQGGDELNLIVRGANYGWPVVGHGVNYGGAVIHSGTSEPGMTGPAHYWVPSIGTSGLMIYQGDAFPQWKGSAFVGGLALPRVARVTLDGTRAVGEETLLEGLGRVRDIREGPDGFIYVAVEARGGAPTPVVRLEPAP